MGLAMDSKDEDVNVSPEEEKMMENLWVACRYAGMSVCRIVTIFIGKKKRKSVIGIGCSSFFKTAK